MKRNQGPKCCYQNPRNSHCPLFASSPTSTANPMQQHQQRRRSRIRRYLRNLTSFLRPMPRNRNPPPGDVPLETNFLPLPQPPPTPTMTPKQQNHIPPIQTHHVPNMPNPAQYVSYGHPIQHTSADVFQHDLNPYPGSAAYSFPPVHPQAMSSTFSHTPDTSFRNVPTQEPPRILRINQIQRQSPPPPPLPYMQPSPMPSEHHVSPPGIRITPPAARMQSHPPHMQQHPARMQPYPVRAQSDLPHPGTANPRQMYHHLPRQHFEVPSHIRQQMLVEALHQRASGMYRPVPQHPNPNLPAAEMLHSQRDPEPMNIDSLPGVTRIPRATRVQTVHQPSPIGVTPPSYPFMNDPSTREYIPQLPIPTSNMSFTLPEATSQHPQSSQFPDPALLSSSLQPHQLARLYGMLQRSTTPTRAPPQSTAKPVQPGKSRRAQKQRARRVPRSPRARAVRALKGDHIFRMLTLSQAPSHWFGSLEIAHVADGRNASVTIPVGAFIYTLTDKPAFTASLPESLKLGTDTARKFDEVVNTAAGGQFMIRVSPVNDYGHTVGNSMYANFVNACMGAGCVHCVQIDAGNLFLFPVSFPQVGISLVGIFVSN